MPQLILLILIKFLLCIQCGQLGGSLLTLNLSSVSPLMRISSAGETYLGSGKYLAAYLSIHQVPSNITALIPSDLSFLALISQNDDSIRTEMLDEVWTGGSILLPLVRREYLTVRRFDSHWGYWRWRWWCTGTVQRLSGPQVCARDKTRECTVYSNLHTTNNNRQTHISLDIVCRPLSRIYQVYRLQFLSNPRKVIRRCKERYYWGEECGSVRQSDPVCSWWSPGPTCPDFPRWEERCNWSADGLSTHLRVINIVLSFLLP